jgi:hypothetical protein
MSDQHTDKTLQPVITVDSRDPITISGCAQFPDFVGELLRRPREEAFRRMREILELERAHRIGISTALPSRSATPPTR